MTWNVISYRLYGSLNVSYFLLSLFLMTNLLISYWECCLFWRRDYIEERARFWRERRIETGRPPATEFLISFFVAKRDRMISRREVCIYIVGPNSPWILFALLGLYVSVRLILDGNYAVLGH